MWIFFKLQDRRLKKKKPKKKNKKKKRKEEAEICNFTLELFMVLKFKTIFDLSSAVLHNVSYCLSVLNRATQTFAISVS